MNNKDVSSYLKYLINYANDQINQNRLSNADVLILHREWTKFKDLIQSEDNIGEKLRNQIMEIDFLDKKLSDDKNPEGVFYTFLTVICRVLRIHGFVHDKEKERNINALLDFRDRLSGIQFFLS